MPGLTPLELSHPGHPGPIRTKVAWRFPYLHTFYLILRAQVPLAAKSDRGGQTRVFERRVYASYALPRLQETPQILTYILERSHTAWTQELAHHKGCPAFLPWGLAAVGHTLPSHLSSACSLRAMETLDVTFFMRPLLTTLCTTVFSHSIASDSL